MIGSLWPLLGIRKLLVFCIVDDVAVDLAKHAVVRWRGVRVCLAGHAKSSSVRFCQTCRAHFRW